MRMRSSIINNNGLLYFRHCQSQGRDRTEKAAISLDKANLDYGGKADVLYTNFWEPREANGNVEVEQGVTNRIADNDSA